MMIKIRDKNCRTGKYQDVAEFRKNFPRDDDIHHTSKLLKNKSDLKVLENTVGEIQEQQLHAGDRSIALLFKYCILQEGVSSNGWSRSKVSHLR
ncbi:hypothetical protein T02_11616 [Trichinella nativa]|uniref:Uncharacterized protein n=1 Tax=Trichinella nativa TaxID=6335 RepID=A0A0V1LQN1_9BILA|nr:hypothetical protein T06_14225 [Trichinella sp. T6]KRZ61832.1 hypothetical protein T02_11616 [Trichinella nativa]